MKPQQQQNDTIDKLMLLNWLSSSGNEIPIEELGNYIAAKTNGKYILIKQENEVNQTSVSE